MTDPACTACGGTGLVRPGWDCGCSAPVECEHVWRSSFGDAFCEGCNQDAPVPKGGHWDVLRERVACALFDVQQRELIGSPFMNRQVEAVLAVLQPPVQQDEPEKEYRAFATSWRNEDWTTDRNAATQQVLWLKDHCYYGAELQERPVPVQQEPERPTSGLVDGGAIVNETPVCLSLPVRDRVAEAIWDESPPAFTMEMAQRCADAALSVLHA